MVFNVIIPQPSKDNGGCQYCWWIVAWCYDCPIPFAKFIRFSLLLPIKLLSIVAISLHILIISRSFATISSIGWTLGPSNCCGPINNGSASGAPAMLLSFSTAWGTTAWGTAGGWTTACGTTACGTTAYGTTAYGTTACGTTACGTTACGTTAWGTAGGWTTACGTTGGCGGAPATLSPYIGWLFDISI